MVTQWGMSERLGPVTLTERRETLARLADRLIAEETIDGCQLDGLLAAGAEAPARPVAVVR